MCANESDGDTSDGDSPVSKDLSKNHSGKFIFPYQKKEKKTISLYPSNSPRQVDFQKEVKDNLHETRYYYHDKSWLNRVSLKSRFQLILADDSQCRHGFLPFKTARTISPVRPRRSSSRIRSLCERQSCSCAYVAE